MLFNKTKKVAGETSIAVALFVGFNLVSFVPLVLAQMMSANIAHMLGDSVGIFMIVNVLLNALIPYVSLRLAATSINQTYIIKDPEKVATKVTRYAFVVNGLFIIISAVLADGVSANMIVGILTVIIVVATLNKYGVKLIHKSNLEEIENAVHATQEPHVGVVVLRTSLLTVLGFVVWVIVPLFGVLFWGDTLESNGYWILLGYYAITIYLFRKIFF